MSALTIHEERLVTDFRDRVKDVLKTDEHHQTTFLIRWLRARNHNMKEAESMLRASLIWRKENKIDQILDVPLDPFYKREFPSFLAGHDKQGHPIGVVVAKNWDFGKLDTPEKLEGFSYYLNFMLEDSYQAILKANKNRHPDSPPVTQFLKIIDLKDYSFGQLCNLRTMQKTLQGASLYEAYYPEILFRDIFINCPRFVNVLVAMVKQVTTSSTFSKISMYGNNRNEWEPALRELMDEDHFSKLIALLDKHTK